MRFIKALIPVYALCFAASCIMYPSLRRIGMRGPIRPEALSFLEQRPTSREDVVLNLGMPDESLQNERIFDYKWIGTSDFAGPAGSGTMGKCNVLRFYFDEHGTVQSVYVHSDTVWGSLRSSNECSFSMSGSRRIAL
jgi:hypothetical protein